MECCTGTNRLVKTEATAWSMHGYFKGEYKQYHLADFKGKWVVMFFYPLDFTFVCPTEIKGFSAKVEEFKQLNAEVIGVSVDSKESHKAWVERDFGNNLNIPLLSDMTKDAAYNYGVLVEEEGTALRGTFIIDPEGVIRYSVVSDNNVGRSVSETIRVLKALQTGELCPVEWQEGEKTLS